jgi:hypothetical protein
MCTSRNGIPLIAAAEQVINSNLYSLMPLYSQNFSADFKNNSESIFEVQMLGNQVPKTGNVKPVVCPGCG